MPQNCPVCGLVNPDSTRNCDCGFVFGLARSVHRPPPPSVSVWLFCSVLLLIGLLGLGISVFSSFYGTTPEEDLTLVEGLPGDISLSEVTGRYGHKHDTLHFTIGGYRTEYGSDAPKFQDVLAVVDGKNPIQAWVSTKRETVFARDDWVPLYKLSEDGKPVLTYSDVVTHSSDSLDSAFVVSAVILAIGAGGLFFCYRRR
jgi:hypothetical protein